MKPVFNADPKKYEEMCKPHPSQESAEAAANAFLTIVQRLREEYRIPELVVQFEMCVDSPEGPKAMRGGGGWGDQMLQARLMKDAFDREFDYLVKVIQQVTATLPRARKMMITDPAGPLTVTK